MVQKWGSSSIGALAQVRTEQLQLWHVQQGCLRHTNTAFGPTVLSRWDCSLLKVHPAAAPPVNQELIMHCLLMLPPCY
jgi:hypothetical protein